MITTTIDVSAIADLGKRFVTLQQADTLLRNIAQGMLPTTFDRIHKDGQKADDSLISNKGYSKSYLKLRQKQPYNQSSDPKVILVLTADMSNNYSIIPLSDKEYALGFTNPTEGKKADWLEQRYGKIWGLTPQELDGVRAIVQDFIQRNFE